MITLTKEWLLKTIAELEEERDATPGAVNEDAAMALAAMKIALASLEAEPVAWLLSGGGAKNNVSFDSGNAYADPLREVTPLYTAHPAPVAPDEMTPQQASRSYGGEVRGYRDGWNACRSAMLHGADGTLTNEGTIPVTQFKPVADLYGLTSPAGSETSFTFDAVEARDFIDGGWSCREYVELGRFQEAMLQNGNSPAQSDCCPEQNYIAPAQDGNSPVIPDGWVACSERMPEDDDFVYIWPRPDFGVELHVAQYGKFDKRDAGWYAQVYEQNYGIEYYPVRVTHWMPLPAAPQQEAK